MCDNTKRVKNKKKYNNKYKKSVCVDDCKAKHLKFILCNPSFEVNFFHKKIYKNKNKNNISQL